MSLNNPRSHPAGNPCVGRCSHCVGDEVCRGCGRTVSEVREWNTLTDAEKIEIKEAARGRLEGSEEWPLP